MLPKGNIPHPLPVELEAACRPRFALPIQSDTGCLDRVKGWTRWLPLVLWMAVVFAGSTDQMSGARTSRFLVPMLRWLKPDISNEALARWQFTIRKATHVFEYGILGILAGRAFGGSKAQGALTAVLWALPFCVAFAALDEFHQAFVPSRQSSLRDIGLDVLGASLGVALIYWIGRQRTGPTGVKAPAPAD